MLLVQSGQRTPPRATAPLQAKVHPSPTDMASASATCSTVYPVNNPAKAPWLTASVCSVEDVPSSRWSTTTLSCGSHYATEMEPRIHVSEAFYDGPYFDPLTPCSGRSFPLNTSATLAVADSPPQHRSPAAFQGCVFSASIRRMVKAAGVLTQRFVCSRPQPRSLETHGELAVISTHVPWLPCQLISRETAMNRDDIVRRPEGFEMRGGQDLFVYF